MSAVCRLVFGMLIPATIGECQPPRSSPPRDYSRYHQPTSTAGAMQSHVQQYPGRYQGSSASLPVGVLNLSTFPATQNVDAQGRAANFAAPVAAGDRAGLGDEVRNMPGGRGPAIGSALHAPWEAASMGRQLRQHKQEQEGTLRHLAQQIPRPPSAGSVAAFAATEAQHRGRSSPTPLHRLPAASLAPPPPPPPPPPPVLSAAQQEHLRQLQQRKRYAQQQQLLQQQRGAGDRVEQLTGTELMRPSPAGYRVQHENGKHPTHEQLQERHPGVLPLPRYANAMPRVPARCTSSVVKVPIYGSVSDGIEHRQQQQTQRQHPRAVSLGERQRQAGGNALAPPPPPPPPPSLAANALPVRTTDAASVAFDSLFSQGRQSPNLPTNGSQKQNYQRGVHDGTMSAAGGLSRQQQQQQQQHRQHRQEQQRELCRTHILPPDICDRRSMEAAGLGSYDVPGRVSIGTDTAPEDRSLKAPVTMAMPLQTAHPRQGSSQAPADAAPPAGLRLQMCGRANAPMSAPVTPVMVYAYPHGYMMAYPTAKVLGVETPQSTRSQAPKVWDPYECVSPTEESTNDGFGRSCKETRSASSESSAVASLSTLLASSRDEMCKPGVDDHSSQVALGQSSRASSVLSDVMNGGLYDNGGVQHRNRQPSSSAESSLHQLLAKSNGIKDVSSKKPTGLTQRGALGSSLGSGVSAVEDKENCPVRGSARLAGKESIDHCGSDGVNDETQMSGKKRGGGDIDIEKQKSFTGSYFQISPGSFLQSNKRQRHFA